MIYNINSISGILTYNSSIELPGSSPICYSMTLSPSGQYFYTLTSAAFNSQNQSMMLNVLMRDTGTGLLTIIDTLDIPRNTYDLLISSDGLYLYTAKINTNIDTNLEINVFAIGTSGGLTSTGNTYVMRIDDYKAGGTEMIEATDGTAIYLTLGNSGIVIDKDPATGIITGSAVIKDLVIGSDLTIAASNAGSSLIYQAEYQNKTIVVLSTICPP